MDLWNGTRQGLWTLRWSISVQGSQYGQKQIIAATLVVFAAFSLSPVAWDQSNPRAEYDLKAAFLVNFAKFIDWPAGDFTSPETFFTICVLGRDPFGQALDENWQGKMIKARRLAVRRLKDKTEARSCQMVFVSSPESAHLTELFESLRGANVLLVGETNGFAASGWNH